MQFFYHSDAGLPSIELDAKDSHYLFSVRRFKPQSALKVRNLRDNNLYFYTHKKKNTFILQCDENINTSHVLELNLRNEGSFHLILAVIDPKDIYDVLPQLNALNTKKISFYYANFSQKNRKLDFAKMQKILQYSCMQCGRTNLMDLQLYSSLQDVMLEHQNACYIDFIDPKSTQKQNIFLENLSKDTLSLHAKQGVIIGPEGGFSTQERNEILHNKQQYALQIPYILTAHLASLYLASLCCSLT